MLQMDTHREERLDFITHLFSVTNDILWFNLGSINDTYIKKQYLLENNIELPATYHDHSNEIALTLKKTIKRSKNRLNILLTMGKPEDKRIQISQVWEDTNELRKRVPLIDVVMGYKEDIESNKFENRPLCEIYKLGKRLNNHFSLGISTIPYKKKTYYSSRLVLELLHHEVISSSDLPRKYISIEDSYCISLEIYSFLKQFMNYTGTINKL
jgi:hypothetical protein